MRTHLCVLLRKSLATDLSHSIDPPFGLAAFIIRGFTRRHAKMRITIARDALKSRGIHIRGMLTTYTSFMNEYDAPLESRLTRLAAAMMPTGDESKANVC